MVQKLQNNHHFITLPKGFSFRVNQADGQVPESERQTDLVVPAAHIIICTEFKFLS